MSSKRVFGFIGVFFLCAALLLHRPITKYVRNHFFTQPKTPSFAVDAIKSIFPSDTSWASPHIGEFGGVFDQKFTYLGDGGQCYAFVSDDRQYVLKFFKQHKFRKKNTPASEGIKRREDAFTSYKVAYDKLREETGLLFLHLVPGDGFQKQVTLVDHLHNAHPVDLGSLEFMLQKRVDLVIDVLSAKMQEGEEEEAKKILDDLFIFFHRRVDKGVLDFDPQIAINLGILDGRIVQIDLGRFSLATKPQMFKTEHVLFKKKNAEFGKWLRKNHPSLYPHYKQHCLLLEEHYKQRAQNPI